MRLDGTSLLAPFLGEPPTGHHFVGDVLDRDLHALVRLAQIERDAGSPLGVDDAILLEAGEAPSRWRRTDLVAHFAACGVEDVARRLDHLHVPKGRVAVVDIGTEVTVWAATLDDEEPEHPARPAVFRIGGS